MRKRALNLPGFASLFNKIICRKYLKPQLDYIWSNILIELDGEVRKFIRNEMYCDVIFLFIVGFYNSDRREARGPGPLQSQRLKR